MKKLFITIFLIISVSFSHDDLYFVDAHSQIDNKVDVNTVLKNMKEFNVKKTLLSTRGKRNSFDVVEWSKEHKEIIPLIRSKGGKYINNHPSFYKMFDNQNSSNDFLGVAEVLIYHAQKGNKAPEVKVDFEDNRFKKILEVCLNKDYPIILHIEFAALKNYDVNEYDKYMTKLENLLVKYPDNKFVLMYLGQLESENVSILLKKYSNLYFMTSVVIEQSNQPWINIFKFWSNELKDEWFELMVQYPNNFVFAIDNVFKNHWTTDYNNRMKTWNSAFSKLPYDVAHKIAHGNAEKLWKLK